MEENQITRDELLSRLKKIEGQVKGIQRMIEEEKCCTDVMVQISAIRSAINKVGGIMIEKYITECMQSGLKASIQHSEVDANVKSVIDTIVKYVR
ncbi:MAG: metal-sensitive transcriptional regulator [Clostridia bacterium]|nr:metal-sensitive transcriptional regulator [Clostridia bacterium]